MEPETIIRHALGDKYEILSVIGKGGMATVYKAIQKSLNRPVALKVIHQNLVHDDEFIKRFIREAQVCSSLSHPNIITVYDVGSLDTVHFMSMEFLEGMTLRDMIKIKGNLSADETSGYIIPIAEALDYIHREGIIHRDVKSSNIFITRSGRVLLMDFGIVFSDSYEALSQSGTMLGTPEYMSAEQAEGNLKIDGRSDIYSLGVVLFECLTSRLPFHSDNYISTLHHVIHDPPSSVTSINPQVPKWINSIVTSCLSKDRNKRIQSGSSLSTALKSRQLIKTIPLEDEYGTRKIETNKVSVKQGVSSNVPTAAGRKKKWVVAALFTCICILLATIYYLLTVSPGNTGRTGKVKQTEKLDTRGIKVLVGPVASDSKNINSTSNNNVAATINEDKKLSEVLALVKQGEEYIRENDPGKALSIFKQALKLEPENNQLLDKIVAATNARDKKLQDSLSHAEKSAEKKSPISQTENDESIVNIMRDVDGNEYKTVKIGNQVWMAENLKTTKFNDGTNIQLVTDAQMWRELSTHGFCYYDNDQGKYGNTYGALYNWYTVNTGKLCPKGWHVPTDKEWTILIDYLGGQSIAGGKLKEIGTEYWISPNIGATNEAGFRALPGAYRDYGGRFNSIGVFGFWWSSTEKKLEENTAFFCGMICNNSTVNRGYYAKVIGLTVRCVRN
jgi:uncharacterized protein (TIGR02145 family)